MIPIRSPAANCPSVAARTPPLSMSPSVDDQAWTRCETRRTRREDPVKVETGLDSTGPYWFRMVPRSSFSWRRDWGRVLAAAVLPPALGTLLALAPDVSTATAALAYVLAVVAASVVGGLPSGLGASLISFLALNFFFTEPFRTFRVSKAEDLVALGVFLVVSVAVSTLVSRALSERSRAERRERETGFQHRMGVRLLAGEPTDEVLAEFARSLVDLLGVAGCEVLTDVGEAREGSTDDRIRNPSREVFPMTARGRQVGQVVVMPGPSRNQLDSEERQVVKALADHLALALEGIRLASEAQEARFEGEKDRLRAALFSSVTHDLRTPLASIRTSVTGLLDPGARFLPEQRRELLETIRHEEERLSRLVGNLLYLSRIRAGAVEPEKSSTDLRDLVEAVVGRMQPQLKEHPVRLMMRDDLPPVPIDVVQVDQALTNLLENAAKFSPPGSTITVQAARWQDEVQVRVSDRGPGVEPGDRERVFEPFVRSDGQSSESGTGLGLSIVRAIVAAHGGSVRIGTAPGGGASVILTLPLET
jgi:two-component system sensor histidine kinase KdpD